MAALQRGSRTLLHSPKLVTELLSLPHGGYKAPCPICQGGGRITVPRPPPPPHLCPPPLLQVQHKLGKDTPLPNLLSVHVGTAVGLRTGRANLLTGERSCHPRVVLCVRGAKRHTARTVQRTARRAGRGDKAGEPALAQEEYSGRQGEGGGAGEGGDAYAPPEYYWGEELSLPLSDASAVLHVCVYDGTAASTLLGQWMTTLKWLVLDPSNCEHSALHVERVGEVAGWFVLSDEKWGRLGGCGEIYLRLSWTHSPGLAPPSPPRLTALEQLSLNSAETTLRLGNPAGVQAVLTHAPFLLDVRRITIRDVEFFVKDLFMGRRGQVPGQGASGGRDGPRMGEGSCAITPFMHTLPPSIYTPYSFYAHPIRTTHSPEPEPPFPSSSPCPPGGRSQVQTSLALHPLAGGGRA